MTVQPTAAPWKLTIEPTHLPGIIRACIEPAEGGPYRGSIATLQNVDWDGGISPDELTANAHLLMAAPDMFAALQVCLTMLDDLAAESGRHVEWGEEDPFRMGEWFEPADLQEIEAARAALAKARGQA